MIATSSLFGVRYSLGFGTNPPGSKAPDRPDFRRGLGFARRFARKRRETACRLRRMDDAKGPRAERGLGASGQARGASYTPSEKLGPPS